MATEPSPRKGGLFAALQEQATQDQDGADDLAARLTARISEGQAAEEGSLPSMWDLLQERGSIARSLHLFLDQVTQKQPVLLLIEDVQWIDPDSRSVLEEMIDHLCSTPVLLVVTSRPDMGWPGEQVPVAPLGEEAARALAAYALRATGLEDSLAAWLGERAEGNPLFVLSYCRALLDSEAVVVDPASDEARWSGPPPELLPSLQELLLAQVDRLGDEASQMLRRAAVIGTSFPASLVAALCDQVLAAESLEQALGRSTRRSVIVPPPPSETYAFGSQSLHDAVYSALSHGQRESWHDWIGDWLCAGDETSRYERLEQIAHHYGRGSDPVKAARFTRLAGDKARVRHADGAALALYAQTLDVAGDQEPILKDKRRAHEGTGDIHAIRGEGDALRAAYQEALDGAAEADALRLQAKLAFFAPLTGQADAAALAEAAAQVSSDDLGVWLGAARCWVLAKQGEQDAAVDACRLLIPTAGKQVGALLKETLVALEAGDVLPPYDDLAAAFAQSQLRLAPESWE